MKHLILASILTLPLALAGCAATNAPCCKDGVCSKTKVEKPCCQKKGHCDKHGHSASKGK